MEQNENNKIETVREENAVSFSGGVLRNKKSGSLQF
jgi:hypothetical protein